MMNDTHHGKFQEYKAALKGRYGTDTYESWFKFLALDAYDQKRVILCAPSKFAAKQICERFSEDMVEIWKEKCGPVKSFEVRGGNGDGASFIPVRTMPSRPVSGVRRQPGGYAASTDAVTPSLARRQQQDTAPQPPLETQQTAAHPLTPQRLRETTALADPDLNIAAPLNIAMSFDRFCVSDCNKLAAAAAMSVLEGETSGLVYVHGGPGRGKTHLLNGIGQEWLRRNADARVLYLTYDNLLNGYVSAVMSKSLPELRAYLDNIDILMVDDVHLLRGRKATQEELLCLIDRLVAKGRAVIVAGAMAPASLAETGLHHRLTDRLGGGLCTPIDKPDFALRLKVLRQMAGYDCANNRICVEERYLQMIARRCDASVREIEGAYRTIRLKTETCQRTNEVITESYVNGVLEEMLRYRRKDVTLDDLLAGVADEFGLSVADLRSRRRPQTIVKGRHAFCMLARKLTDSPLKVVGACLGRDHTTVLSSLSRGEVLAETDPTFGGRISRLMDKFSD